MSNVSFEEDDRNRMPAFNSRPNKPSQGNSSMTNLLMRMGVKSASSANNLLIVLMLCFFAIAFIVYVVFVNPNFFNFLKSSTAKTTHTPHVFGPPLNP